MKALPLVVLACLVNHALGADMVAGILIVKGT